MDPEYKTKKDNRIKVYKINNQNILAKSRNLGIKKSTSSWLCFIDSDDIWYPKKLEITKSGRMPWFCPECTKVLKRRLDEKMWYLYDHCFNCQIKVENKMRIEGTYDKWAEKKIIANKLAWITDQKQSIEEFKNQKAPEFMEQFRPDGYSVDRETWKMNSEGITKQADEALEHLQKLEDSLK